MGIGLRRIGDPAAASDVRSSRCSCYVPAVNVFTTGSREKQTAPGSFASGSIVTSNLPFQEWTSVFASERLTGALLDRITHHVHILEMNGESYRLKQSRSRRRPPSE